MLRIAICDDEQKLRSGLKSVLSMELELRGTEYTIKEFSSGESLVEGFTASDIDILFLDIEMNKLNGMETAKQIRLIDNRAVIIFVTSYPDYVFEGYEVKALNYILKPYKEEKIIEVLYEALKALDKSVEKYYVVEQKTSTKKLALSESKYFYSEKRTIFAVSLEEEISFYGKLNDVEVELPDFFVRIHNRYLVNINFVSEIRSNSVECGGIELPISRNYKQNLAVAFAKNMLR